ncbi:hypothetical protein QYE76_003589 [Lolium multiflorum]|uniref:DUF8039 domain-containing protein n=1 Tax=Lolium multiflorum TaxID=4521 RepID=A0AAD8RQI4_LOLMU|nr:hypothetical protein QYE76_003589 [Lolium multiflorum]
MENYDPEIEEQLFGIIKGDIPYVPTEQDEEDISSYLNLDGQDEGRQQDDGEETSINDDLQLQVATSSGAEPSAGSSKKSSTSSSKRGATKTLKPGETYTIEVVDSATGRPLEPPKYATKFINQCGAVVRDNISITLQEWNEPKKARLGFTFVDKRTKKDCFQKLMEHFILPPEYHKFDEAGNKIQENKERRRLLKHFALGKMADTFRKFKQNLARDYVNQNKTPEFKGQSSSGSRKPAARSCVVSTEVQRLDAPEIQITAPEPPRYPVDDVKEMKQCHLHYPTGNMSTKVAIGSALPCEPGALHHNNPIADGYARVTVEEIVPWFEDLEIDIATPEGERRLGGVKRLFSGKRSLSSFQTRRQGEQVHPLRWWWRRRRRRWWWFTYTSFTSADAAPIHLRRVLTPPPSTSGPPAKKRKQSWTINPDPYVPRTTKIPEPSLKPLTPRPYDLSVEENAAVVAAQHEKWQADCKKKREPEPKPVYSDKQKKWAKSFLTEPSQAAKNLPDYYSHELRRQAFILKEKQELAEKQEKKASHSESKKEGKQVAQLGEQSKQSIAPLIVKAAGPDDPEIIAAAARQGLTVASAIEQAANLGLTLRAVLGLDEATMKDVVITYVSNGPLVEPAQEKDLPPQMTGLLNCELFQLFNLRELDKSIISCYVPMKKRECIIRNIHDVGFIDPHIVNSYVLQHFPADMEADLWMFFSRQELKSDILFPYHFGFHWILLVIQFHDSTVLIHDSLNMNAKLWADLRKMMQK